MALWHQDERLLAEGDIIEPGRWGATILAQGQAHPLFFREQFLELWRWTNTEAPPSRLSSNFALEDRDVALQRTARDASTAPSYCYEVEPLDATAPHARLNILWLTWMGQPGATFDKVAAQCRAYWDGRPTAEPGRSHQEGEWEWLFDCGLRILRRIQ